MLAGNQRSFQQLLPTRFAPKTTDGRELVNAFPFSIRDEALVLNALGKLIRRQHRHGRAAGRWQDGRVVFG